MKRIIISIGMMVCFAVASWAQSEQANRFFQQGDYATALGYYKQCVAREGSNAYYVYRYARCLQEVGRAAEAITLFENPITTRYNTRAFFLGRAYMDVRRYTDARHQLESFLEENHESSFYAEAGLLLEQVERLERFYQSTEALRLIEGTVVEKNQLLSSYPQGAEQGQLEVLDWNDHIHCATVYTNPRGDRRIRANADGLILLQSRLLDDWSENDTLPFRGWWPVLMADGTTIYYSAEHENGAGGLDIYYTRFNSSTNTYLQPINAGSPYSSWGNDYFYFVDEQAQRGYFATDRLTPDGQVGVYSFVVPEEKHYLRGEDEETMRQELIALSRFDGKDDLQGEPTAPVVAVDEPDFRLVVNDSLVYEHLADFRSDSARVRYEQYQALEADWEKEKEELTRMRANYSYSTGEERAALGSVIMALEKDVVRLRDELRALLHEVLLIEQSLE